MTLLQGVWGSTNIKKTVKIISHINKWKESKIVKERFIDIIM